MAEEHQSQQSIYEQNVRIQTYVSQAVLMNDADDLYEFIQKRKDIDVSQVSSALSSFSYSLQNAPLLAKNKERFYRFRQSLYQRKQVILDDQNFLVHQIKVLQRRQVESYKFGNNPDGLRPSNEYERKALIDGNLAGYQLCSAAIDAHIAFLMDSIKNLSDMIFGFDIVLRLEEYRKIG